MRDPETVFPVCATRCGAFPGSTCRTLRRMKRDLARLEDRQQAASAVWADLEFERFAAGVEARAEATWEGGSWHGRMRLDAAFGGKADLDAYVEDMVQDAIAAESRSAA